MNTMKSYLILTIKNDSFNNKGVNFKIQID